MKLDEFLLGETQLSCNSVDLNAKARQACGRALAFMVRCRDSQEGAEPVKSGQSLSTHGRARGPDDDEVMKNVLDPLGSDTPFQCIRNCIENLGGVSKPEWEHWVDL